MTVGAFFSNALPGMRHAALLTSAALFATVPSAHAQSAATTWWSRTDPQTRILLNRVNAAESGKLNSQLAVAAMFAAGRGSPEGPKPDTARYWLERAADNGSEYATLMEAALYAAETPPNIAKASELLERTQYVDKSTEGENHKGAFACTATAYCRAYFPMIGAYHRLFVEYPRSAREKGEEASFKVRIDFETREIEIIGNAIPPDFADAAKRSFSEALKRIPAPPEFESKGKRVNYPISFKLDD